jgi:hypothetical protein
LQALAKDFRGGQLFHSEGLPEKGGFAVFGDRIEVWFAHTHQPDHGFGNVGVWNSTRYALVRPQIEAT